jgi:hypothetical protein
MMTVQKRRSLRRCLAPIVLLSCTLGGCTGLLAPDTQVGHDTARPGNHLRRDGGLATGDAGYEQDAVAPPGEGPNGMYDAGGASADASMGPDVGSGAPDTGDGASDSGDDSGGSDSGGDDSGGSDSGGNTGGGEDSGSTAPDGLSETSLEVGRTLWGNDHGKRSDAPAGGTLFSVWTKMPDPGSSYPWMRGNLDVYVLSGSNWSLRCLVANSGAESPSDARYSANSMLLAQPRDTWIGDFSYYESGGGYPEAPYRDWVWAAWQVVVESDAFTIRQWLKLGVTGPVFAAGESRVTFEQARAVLRERGWSQDAAAAWVPSDATAFQVGSDRGFLTEARMSAQAAQPSLAELDAIATGRTSAAAAWAYYPLVWESGAAILQDRSGHGRDLELAPGGTLHPGPAGPPL